MAGTLREQFQELLDAGQTPEAIASSFKDNFGVSHKEFSPDTPMSALRTARDTFVKPVLTLAKPTATPAPTPPPSNFTTAKPPVHGGEPGMNMSKPAPPPTEGEKAAHGYTDAAGFHPPVAVESDVVGPETQFNLLHPVESVVKIAGFLKGALPPSSTANPYGVADQLLSPTEQLAAHDTDVKARKEYIDRQIGAANTSRTERREHTVSGNGVLGGIAQGAANIGEDLFNTIAGLVSRGNELIGVSHVPEEARTNWPLVPTVKSIENAEQVGIQMGEALPGQTYDLARGFVDLSGSNSLVTKPFTTWATVIEPGLSLAKVSGLGGKVGALHAKVVNDVLKPAVVKVVDGIVTPGTAEKWGASTAEVKAQMVRVFTDSLTQADPRHTAALARQLEDPGAHRAELQNQAELIARQIAQGKVKLEQPNLNPVELSIQPAANKAVAERSMAQAGKVEADAVRANIRSEGADTAAQFARQVNTGIRKLQNKVEAVKHLDAAPLAAQTRDLSTGLRAHAREAEATATKAEADAFRANLRSEGADTAAQFARQVNTSIRKLQGKAQTAERGIAAGAERANEIVNSGPTQRRVNQMEAASARAAVPSVALAEAVKPLDAALLAAQTRDLSTGLRAHAREAEATATKAEADAFRANLRSEGADTAAQFARQVNTVMRKLQNNAEAVKHLDAAPLAAQTRNLSTGLRPLARKAEAAATKALDEAAMAGHRPAVSAGTIYLPREPGRLAIVEPGASEANAVRPLNDTLGPGLDEAGKPLPPKFAEPVMQAATVASDAKKLAMEAGFDPLAPAPPLSQPLGKASIGEAAAELARRLQRRHVPEPEQVLTATLRSWGVEPKAAGHVADWFLGEEKLHETAKVMETEHGGRRRPTPEVTSLHLGTDGKDIGRMGEAVLAEDRAAQIESGQREAMPGYGPARTGESEVMHAWGRTLPEEAPRAIRSNNPIVNEALDRMAEIQRDQGYHASGHAEDAVVAKKPISIADASPEEWTNIAPTESKKVTNATVSQRFLEPLENDTTQLLGSRDVRSQMLKDFRGNAERYGLKGDALDNAVNTFYDALIDPRRLSAISKNRFFEIFGDKGGKPIWNRDDFAKSLQNMPKDKLNNARANAVRDKAWQTGSAIELHGTLRNIAEDANRFRRDAEGKPYVVTRDVVDPETGETSQQVTDASVGYGDSNAFAHQVAVQTIKDGAMRPMTLPFAPDVLIKDLQAKLQSGRLARDGVPDAKVKSLIEYLRQFKPAPKGLIDAANDAWRVVFKGTDAEAVPPSFDNLYVKPSVAQSLTSHFNSLGSGYLTGTALGRLIYATGQRMKSGLIAESLPTLWNNDVSNIMLQILSRADPAMLKDIIALPFIMKRFLDGKHEGFSPDELRMYSNINRTSSLQQGFVHKEIGHTQMSRAISEAMPGLAEAVGHADAQAVSKGGYHAAASKALEGVDKLQNFLQESYSNYGDSPFRLEEQVYVYKKAQAGINALKDGEYIDLPVGTQRVVRVTRQGNGVHMMRMEGDRAITLGTTNPGGTVALDSEALARVMAETGNFFQEQKFFNYGKTGLMAKAMRNTPILNLASGVFSWYFKALDLPGKKGLLGKILEGPVSFATTSPELAVAQAADRVHFSFRRAAVVANAQAGSTEDRQLKEAETAASWNPAVRGKRLAGGRKPGYLDVQNIEPLDLFSPTKTAMSLIGTIAERASHPSQLMFSDPQGLSDMLRPNDLAKVQAVTGVDDPAEAMRVYAQKMGSDPEFAQHVETVTARMDAGRKLLWSYVKDEMFSRKQAMSLLGLGGSPMMTQVMKLMEARHFGKQYGTGQVMAGLARMLVGASLYDGALDIAPGIVGQTLGIDALSNLSGYGKEREHGGFHGGTDDADYADVWRWGLRTFIGLGWKTVDFTGEDSKGRIRQYLNDAKMTVNADWLKPAEDAMKTAIQLHGVDSQQAQSAEEAYESLKQTIDDELGTGKNSKGQLMELLNAQAENVRTTGIRKLPLKK